MQTERFKLQAFINFRSWQTWSKSTNHLISHNKSSHNLFFTSESKKVGFICWITNRTKVVFLKVETGDNIHASFKFLWNINFPKFIYFISSDRKPSDHDRETLKLVQKSWEKICDQESSKWATSVVRPHNHCENHSIFRSGGNWGWKHWWCRAGHGVKKSRRINSREILRQRWSRQQMEKFWRTNT